MDNRQHSKAPRMTRSQKLAAALANTKRAWQNAIGQALPANYFKGIDPEDAHAVGKLQRRRAKNKVARKSRRTNRKVAQR